MEGVEVQCQMNDPEEHHYGDACYVGHSGNIMCTVQNDKLYMYYPYMYVNLGNGLNLKIFFL